MPADEILTIKLQSQALIDAGRFEEAAQMLAHGLSIAPGDDDLLCQMAQACLALNQVKEANLHIERALSVAPENSWAHRLRSIALRKTNRHESVKSAQEAARLEPNDPWCWQVLVGAHLQVFNLKEARIAAERLRGLAPEWPVAHQSLCLVALKEEKYKEAEEHCRRELALDPNSYEGMNNLGVALLNQKKKRAAIEAFNHAAKLNPAAPVARDNISAAVSRYLPRITIPIFALYLLFNGLRVMGEKGGSGLAVTALCVIGLLVATFLVIRWYRFRTLPSEVKQYVKLTREPRRTEQKRRWLLVAGGLATMFLGFWLIVFYVLWDEGRVSWTVSEFIFPALMISILVACFIVFRRVPRDK
jgi:tetratricopeptide (TPR) repeat protein